MCSGLDKCTLEANTCYQDDNGGSNLLSVMDVVIVYDRAEFKFNVLIHSGNERSYLADSLRLVLNWKADALRTR